MNTQINVLWHHCTEQPTRSTSAIIAARAAADLGPDFEEPYLLCGLYSWGADGWEAEGVDGSDPHNKAYAEFWWADEEILLESVPWPERPAADTSAEIAGKPAPTGRLFVGLEFIPVSEALPDDDSTVLVIFDDGEMGLAYLDAGQWFMNDSMPVVRWTITHWAELQEVAV